MERLATESHAYAARESNEQVIWEMLTWCDTYVRDAAPMGKAGEAAGG